MQFSSRRFLQVSISASNTYIHRKSAPVESLPFSIDLQYNVHFFSYYSSTIFQLHILHNNSVEHSMCMIVGINRVSVCTNSTSFEGYFKQSWPQVYTIVKYDGGIRGILSELLNYYCTFLWTFMDIFIISISICLSTRFNLLNDHLKQFKGMVNSILLSM